MSSTFPADALFSLLELRLCSSFQFIDELHILMIIHNSVQYPDGHVDTLESNEHVHVEQDGEVKTQEE